MTISRRVQKELLQSNGPEHTDAMPAQEHQQLGYDPNAMFNKPPPTYKTWTPEEHERFMEGLEKYPTGPWKKVAEYVGTKTARQTMTHAQKYREKLARRKRNSGQMRFQRLTNAHPAKPSHTDHSPVLVKPHSTTSKFRPAVGVPQQSQHRSGPILSAEEIDFHVLAHTLQKPRLVASVSQSSQRSDYSTKSSDDASSCSSSSTSCDESEREEDHATGIDVDALMDLLGHQVTTSQATPVAVPTTIAHRSNVNHMMATYSIQPLGYETMASVMPIIPMRTLYE